MKKPAQLFHHINQWNSKFCTVYSACINLKYNTGIVINDSEMKEIIVDSIKKWKLSENKWWWLKSNFLEVYNYIKRNNPEVKYKIFRKDSSDFKKYFNAWYMIECWIMVNKDFIKDFRDDSKINWSIYDIKWIYDIDYINYKWNAFRHATNTIKRIIKDADDYLKEYIYDSYYWNKYNWNEYNLYEINIKEMIEDIFMPTCYLFYID